MKPEGTPLQLMRDPMVEDSRQLNPAYLAARVQPPNFPENARVHMAMVKPQVIPASSSSRVSFDGESMHTVIQETQVSG